MLVPSLGFVPDLSWAREPPHLLFGRIHPVLITAVDPKGLERLLCPRRELRREALRQRQRHRAA
ncbi:hypothetical protein ACPA9J_27575 [Pseudomonas aeruginosa]